MRKGCTSPDAERAVTCPVPVHLGPQAHRLLTARPGPQPYIIVAAADENTLRRLSADGGAGKAEEYHDCPESASCAHHRLARLVAARWRCPGERPSSDACSDTDLGPRTHLCTLTASLRSRAATQPAPTGAPGRTRETASAPQGLGPLFSAGLPAPRDLAARPPPVTASRPYGPPKRSRPAATTAPAAARRWR